MLHAGASRRDLTAGEARDAPAALALLCRQYDKVWRMPPSAELVFEKGYCGNELRPWSEGRVSSVVVPPKQDQRPLDPAIFKQRNIIERILGRFENRRRVVTWFNWIIKNFVVTIAIAATVISSFKGGPTLVASI